MVEINMLERDSKRSGFGFNVWLSDGLNLVVTRGLIASAANTIADNKELQSLLYAEIRKAIVDFGPELTKKAVRAFLAEK